MTRGRHVVDGNVFQEDDHGSMILVPEDGSAPGRQEILLRGQFALVRYYDRVHSYDQDVLVLLGTQPINRKIVYSITTETDPESGVERGVLHLLQDSPGMAGGGEG